MCGITGFIDPSINQERREERLKITSDAIYHRGPDDHGTFQEPDVGLGFAHRRLSILDLSPLGHQPMTSASERFVMIYNGEVYNGPQLGKELEGKGYAFRGHSDTEVMLAAFEEWGITASLKRFVGMFALAVWDRQERHLILARDRAGIKPLFYSLQGTRFFFGSELKCLLSNPEYRDVQDPVALNDYLRLGYIPAPATIYKDTAKLLPGHILTLDLSGDAPKILLYQPFWSYTQVVKDGIEARRDESEVEALDRFEGVLEEAVRSRMLADVPLGAFLSGGIDSSLVVAQMQKLASQPVKTFSIGFEDKAFDEAVHAREIAAHLGTQHHEYIMSEEELLKLVPELPKYWCEPFGDSSQLPTLVLSRFARQHVTVALSGDGGDELAAGYVRHINAGRLHKLGNLPYALRGPLAGVLKVPSVQTYDKLYGLVGALLPKSKQARLPGDKIHKLARALGAKGADMLYDQVVDLDAHGSLLAHAPVLRTKPWWQQPEGLSPAEDFMVRDFMRYLPDDVLTKVDRATMAASLEARVPLLDHNLLACGWSIQESLKLRDGGGKYLLKKVLERHVPRNLWDRPKMGFAAPVGTWLRGPLKDWGADLINSATTINPALSDKKVRHLWLAHQDHKGNVINQLWHLLMLLAWGRFWGK